MGNKTGVLLSLIVLLQFLLFSGNLIHYQISVAHIYALIPVINDYISYKGEINDEIKDFVFENSGAEITCSDYCFAFSGDFLEYQLEIEIEPIFATLGFSETHLFVVVQKVLIGY